MVYANGVKIVILRVSILWTCMNKQSESLHEMENKTTTETKKTQGIPGGAIRHTYTWLSLFEIN